MRNLHAFKNIVIGMLVCFCSIKPESLNMFKQSRIAIIDSTGHWHSYGDFML